MEKKDQVHTKVDQQSHQQTKQQTVVEGFEQLLEQSLDKLTSSPTFLNGVSLLLNLNSHRKIWFRKTMEAVWKDLELPVRGEQNRLLSHVEELTVRIKKLELELQRERRSSDPSGTRSGRRKSKLMPVQTSDGGVATVEVELQ